MPPRSNVLENGGSLASKTATTTSSSSSSPLSSGAVNDRFGFGNGAAYVPEDKDQWLVKTPYGVGQLVRTRPPNNDGVIVREYELINWQQLQPPSAPDDSSASSSLDRTSTLSPAHHPHRPATLYATTVFPSVPPQQHDQVVCKYGRGKIVHVRDIDNMYVVRLSTWRLAHRATVTCYLPRDQLQVVRPKLVYEMNVYEKVEAATDIKKQAAKLFAGTRYAASLAQYARAVDVVRYVHHTPHSSNEVRADLLVLMVTCCNNAATCCSKLAQQQQPQPQSHHHSNSSSSTAAPDYWHQAIKFAQNAVVLIDAMEEKKGGKIHGVLQRDGYNDVMVFGVWRVKSYLVQALGRAAQHDPDAARTVLQTAKTVITTYTTDPTYTENMALAATVKNLTLLDREVRRLANQVKIERQVQRDKERQRAQAMFARDDDATTDVETSTNGDGSSHNNSVGANNDKSPEAESPQTPRGRMTAKPTMPASPIRSPQSIARGRNGSSSDSPASPKRVSFADDLVLSTSGLADVGNSNQPAGGNDDSNMEPDWYRDREVLTGWAFFGGAVVGSVLLWSWTLNGRRR